MSGIVARATTLENRLLRRRCLACGYDGKLLRDGLAARCARCGCNLRKRAARSYAEMEGFAGRPTARARREAQGNRCDEQRLVQRWLVFLILAMLGLVAIVYLGTAAFSV